MRTCRTVIMSEVRGEKLEVEAEAEVCDRCGIQVLTDAQVDPYTVASADAYRVRHGLLISAEIRDVRHRLGNMSQRAFAKYLGVGEASVKRWELGLVQDESNDRLIRMKTDLQVARANVRRISQYLRDAPPAEPAHVR